MVRRNCYSYAFMSRGSVPPQCLGRRDFVASLVSSIEASRRKEGNLAPLLDNVNGTRYISRLV